MSDSRLGLHQLCLRVVLHEKGKGLRTLRRCGRAAHFPEEEIQIAKAKERLRVQENEA